MKPEFSKQITTSSTITLIEWYADKTLRVGFKSGGTYRFADVPKDIAETMAGADSPGSYFAKYVKAKYASTKEETVKA